MTTDQMDAEPVAALRRHDPKLVAALLKCKRKLEALPEGLRGPFKVTGLEPYAAPQAPHTDTGELEALRKERDEARALVVEANNSLYGSQGYFHSLNGGPFDKWHLAKGIEELKSSSRKQGQLEARVKALEAALSEECEACALILDADAFAIEANERDCRSWGGPDPRGAGVADQNLNLARSLRSAARTIRARKTLQGEGL